jgi:hypothetical protein
MELIHGTAKNITFRKTLRPHEVTRVKEAFALLTEPQRLNAAPAYQKKGDYDQYLRKIYETGGVQLVMTCVLAIGHHALCKLSQHVRQELLDDMTYEWGTPILQSLAQERWTEGRIPALTPKPAY